MELVVHSLPWHLFASKKHRQSMNLSFSTGAICSVKPPSVVLILEG